MKGMEGIKAEQKTPCFIDSEPFAAKDLVLSRESPSSLLECGFCFSDFHTLKNLTGQCCFSKW
jgi:hypothetical protein